MGPEEKASALGCLAAIVVIAAIVSVLVWMSQNGMLSASKPEEKAALTRVAPVREKAVVKDAKPQKPLARKVSTEDTDEDTEGRSSGFTAGVVGLDSVTREDPVLPPLAMDVQLLELTSEAVCYEGRLARKAPSLFTRDGFAITYGSDDYNTGDPLPRLEIFFGSGDPPSGASYLSMSEKKVPDFPGEHEVPIAYSSSEINKVIAKWIASVATGVCPRNAPTFN